MSEKQIIKISNLIDWSRSFVDPDGSFYRGTTGKQKENADRIINISNATPPFTASALDTVPPKNASRNSDKGHERKKEKQL